MLGWRDLSLLAGRCEGKGRCKIKNKKKLGMHRERVSCVSPRSRWGRSGRLWGSRALVAELGAVERAGGGGRLGVGGGRGRWRCGGGVGGCRPVFHHSCVLCPELGRWAASRCRCPDFPDFPRLWGKRVRAGDVRERQRASLYELGDSGRRLAGVGRGPGGRSGCALVVGATHCGAPATTRSTICINSTERRARSRQPATLQPEEGIRQRGVDVGPSLRSCLAVLCCSLVLQRCSQVLADLQVLALVVGCWLLHRRLDAPFQRGDVPGCWPSSESNDAMERGVGGGEVEGRSETKRDADAERDAEMQRCRDAEGRNKSAGAAEAFLRNGMSRGRSWAGKQRLRSACAARCCTGADGNLRWETGRRPRK